MPRDPGLTGLVHFEAGARRATVSRAAEVLGVSPCPVSQQVRALEAEMGRRLFRREGRSLTLTLVPWVPISSSGSNPASVSAA